VSSAGTRSSSTRRYLILGASTARFSFVSPQGREGTVRRKDASFRRLWRRSEVAFQPRCESDHARRRGRQRQPTTAVAVSIRVKLRAARIPLALGFASPAGPPVAAYRCRAAKTFQRGEEVTIAPVAHGAVVSSTGRLTCISRGAASIRAGTILAASGVSWTVFAQQGGTLFVWHAPSIQESSRIEAISLPSIC